MAYIHIASSKGFGVDDVKRIEEKVGPRNTVAGLLVETYGYDGETGLHITVWESKAHKDRYEAEQLLPAFQAAGIAAAVAANIQFAEREADSLYIR